MDKFFVFFLSDEHRSQFNVTTFGNHDNMALKVIHFPFVFIIEYQIPNVMMMDEVFNSTFSEYRISREWMTEFISKFVGFPKKKNKKRKFHFKNVSVQNTIQISASQIRFDFNYKQSVSNVKQCVKNDKEHSLSEFRSWKRWRKYNIYREKKNP